jgi:hypothetical protein
MNNTVQTLINQSMQSLKDAIAQSDDLNVKMQLQKILDDYQCTVNNLD